MRHISIPLENERTNSSMSGVIQEFSNTMMTMDAAGTASGNSSL